MCIHIIAGLLGHGEQFVIVLLVLASIAAAVRCCLGGWCGGL